MLSIVGSSQADRFLGSDIVNARPLMLGVWFDADPGARFALSTDGRILAANPAARAMLVEDRLGARTDGRLQFGTSLSESQFTEAFAACARTGQSKRLILRLKDGEWASADVRQAAEGDLLILAFHQTGRNSDRHGLEALASAFHLTGTEAMILRDLCNGECPKSVARLHGTSEHTVRAHLRAIYTKMGAKGLTNTVVMAVQLMS